MQKCHIKASLLKPDPKKDSEPGLTAEALIKHECKNKYLG